MAVDAGEAPLDVYADWCEEQAFDWAAGVRMLAATERWPTHDNRGWYWRLDLSERIRQDPHPAILPIEIWRAVHPKLAEMGGNAMTDGERENFPPGHFRPPHSYPRFASLGDAVERAARAMLLSGEPSR